MNKRLIFLAAAWVPMMWMGSPSTAMAQASEVPTASEEMGLNLDVGFATAYVYRGWNVFQREFQTDPHMLLAPGATWAIGDSGVTVGYWAAYQLTGANTGANTDGALNAEQDLFVTYDLELPQDVTMSFGLTAYAYPVADAAVIGASVPLYFEPAIAWTYATAVDLGLAVSYLAGVQNQPDIWGLSYLYLNPSVAKSLELSENLGLELGLGYGFKLFNEGIEGRDNVHDVTLTAALPVHPGGPTAYVAPGIGVAWTNVEDVTDDDSGEVLHDRNFADGFVTWVSLNLGMDI
jgi:hypothetical protein